MLMQLKYLVSLNGAEKLILLWSYFLSTNLALIGSVHKQFPLLWTRAELSSGKLFIKCWTLIKYVLKICLNCDVWSVSYNSVSKKFSFHRLRGFRVEISLRIVSLIQYNPIKIYL